MNPIDKVQPQQQSNSEFIAIVRDLASDGRGIVSHPNGVTVFVPGVWVGEQCRIRFHGLQNKIGLGELTEVLEPSPHRVQAPCIHHGNRSGDCGGCPWQFIDYQEQLNFKQQKVAQAFGRLNFHSVQKIWPSPTSLAYRNRAQFKTDGNSIGYLSSNSHSLAKIDNCLVLNQYNQNTLAELIKKLPNKDWRPKKISNKYGKRKQTNHLTSLNIDDNLSADQVMVNKRLPFRQSHDAQNKRMKEWLHQGLIKLSNQGPVLELFCGSGNFTDVISAAVSEDIVATEADEKSIGQLEQKQLGNVKAVQIDLFSKDCFEKIYNIRRDFTTLVLDPPRDGLKVTDHLISKKSKLNTIFYISCNLATLCRDVAFFIDQGFDIIEVQPLDQSPHTPHIEFLLRLEKKSR